MIRDGESIGYLPPNVDRIDDRSPAGATAGGDAETDPQRKRRVVVEPSPSKRVSPVSFIRKEDMMMMSSDNSGVVDEPPSYKITSLEQSITRAFNNLVASGYYASTLASLMDDDNIEHITFCSGDYQQQQVESLSQVSMPHFWLLLGLVALLAN